MAHTEGRVYKTSRIAFVGNYVIAALLVLFLVMFYWQFKLTFTFTPTNLVDLGSSMGVLLMMIVIVLLVEEPVMRRMIHHFIVTNNEIIKVEGIITKKKISIPYQSVADVRVKKGVFGRILNFGNVYIHGMGRTGTIKMIGMRAPDEIYNLLQKKISLMRSAFIDKDKME